MGHIEQIQAWYAAQCDGDWEHQYGVSIETLDNPGWRVIVDFSGSSLDNISLQTHQEDKGEEGWIFCEMQFAPEKCPDEQAELPSPAISA
jgi:hypothetical protein